MYKRSFSFDFKIFIAYNVFELCRATIADLYLSMIMPMDGNSMGSESWNNTNDMINTMKPL